MKLIKKGRAQKGWAKQFTCTGKRYGRGGCGAVFLVEEADLLRGERWVMGRDHEEWAYFRCAECGIKTEVTAYPGDLGKLATHRDGGDVLKPDTGNRVCPQCDGHCPPGQCYNVPG